MNRISEEELERIEKISDYDCSDEILRVLYALREAYAELDRLTAANASWEETNLATGSDCVALQADIARLCDALRPFASLASYVEQLHPVGITSSGNGITEFDRLHAAAVLREVETGATVKQVQQDYPGLLERLAKTPTTNTGEVEGKE